MSETLVSLAQCVGVLLGVPLMEGRELTDEEMTSLDRVLGSDLPRKMDAYGMVVRDLEARAKALNDERKAIASAIGTIARMVEKLRSRQLEAMDAIKESSLASPLGRWTVQTCLGVRDDIAIDLETVKTSCPDLVESKQEVWINRREMLSRYRDGTLPEELRCLVESRRFVVGRITGGRGRVIVADKFDDGLADLQDAGLRDDQPVRDPVDIHPVNEHDHDADEDVQW